MKFNISLLTISLCASLLASDEQPQHTGLTAMRARLRANRGQTAPELTREQQSAPSARDLVKAAQNDSPEDFEKTLRSFLDNNPGCKTWDESCESACPKSDKAIDWNTDVSSIPGFDQPITCKDYLGSCYRNLRGCSNEELNNEMKKTTVQGLYLGNPSYSHARCQAIALICQGANPNTDEDKNDYNKTPLHRAALINDYHFAQFLLEHEASAKYTNKNNYTALHTNTHNPGGAETARLLIDNGADVDAKNKWGYSPLMNLAFYCYNYSGISTIIDKTKLLFSAGAKTHHHVTYGSFSGKTALDIARARHAEYNSESCKALADYIQAHEEQQNRIQD